MARYAKFFSLGGGGGTNNLQLPVGTILDTTLRQVQDGTGTGSPLYLSTGGLRVGTTAASAMYWDDTNNRLGVGTTTPLGILHLKSTAAITRMVIDGDAGFNRLISYRTGAVQRFGLYVNNTAESGSNVGSDFAIRAYNDAGTLLNTPVFIKRSTGQVTFSERVNVESDSLVTTQVSSVIQATTTNANLVIAPNGTGALIAQIPDGTFVGGNARGTNAVDLQMGRNAIENVASGNNATIGGGYSNKASGTVAPTVAGGQYNFATGLFVPTIGGGSNNIASSSYSTVSGGQSNTASTGTHATVVGGQSNVSSGQHSVSGGNGNAASGTKSIALGGSNNAQAESSVTLGQQNVTTQPYSFSSGYFASSYLYGQKSHQNGRFDLAGDAQVSQLVARKSDTLLTAATTVLSLDGTGTTNLIIPTGVNRMWNVTIKFVAVVTTITGTATGVTVGDTKSQNIEIGFKKVGGVSSLVGSGVYSIPQEDASMGSASLIPTAGASQQLALTFTAPTFTGGGSVTCRVVAKVELVEVAY
jgi:hypothetical protein